MGVRAPQPAPKGPKPQPSPPPPPKKGDYSRCVEAACLWLCARDGMTALEVFAEAIKDELEGRQGEGDAESV